MYGKPLQIVNVDGTNIEFEEDLLRKTLLTSEIKDRYICVISIAGAFRKGKSFILNFFLRFMYMKYVHKDMGNLFDDTNIPLTGFSWRSGIERDTTGILMWSDVFLHDFENGEKVAIILLDTQGSFDHQSTVRDCASIFALSTMISSVQIYNISQQIQENDLQHLELFVNYGKIATECSSTKPFQRLIFLIRDWYYPGAFTYGKNGGQKYLEKVLTIKDKEQSELQVVRSNIDQCFMESSCFLLPHPGLKVASDPNFKGSLNMIEPDFKESLIDLFNILLSPSNLVIKKVNGHKVLAKDWIENLKIYTEVFKGDTMPDPKSIFLATAELHNNKLSSDAHRTYSQQMEELSDSNKPYLTEDDLETLHVAAFEKAISEFDNVNKIGGPEMIAQYRNEIVVNINDHYEKLKSLNKTKFMEWKSKLTNCVEDAKCLYINDMKSACKEYVTHLSDINTKFRNKALGKFDMDSQCHIDTLGNTYRDKLIQILNGEYLNFEQLNNGLKMKLENNNLNAVSIAKDVYNQSMEKACKSHVKYILLTHNEFKEIAISKYNEFPNCGNAQFKKPYIDKLDQFFEERFKNFEKLNNEKYSHILEQIKGDYIAMENSYVTSMNAASQQPHLSDRQLLLIQNNICMGLISDLEAKWQNYSSELDQLNIAFNDEMYDKFIQLLATYHKLNANVAGRIMGIIGKATGAFTGGVTGMVSGTVAGLVTGLASGAVIGGETAYKDTINSFGDGVVSKTMACVAGFSGGIVGGVCCAIVNTTCGLATGVITGSTEGYKQVKAVTKEGDLAQNILGAVVGTVKGTINAVPTAFVKSIKSACKLTGMIFRRNSSTDFQEHVSEARETIVDGFYNDFIRISH